MRRAAHAQLSPCDCPPNIRYVSGMVPYYGVPLGTKKTPSLLTMLFILYVCSMAQAKYMFFLILEILKYKLRHLPPFLVICMFTLRHLPPCLRPVTPLPVTVGFLSQRASSAENVFIWWRHHDIPFLNTAPALQQSCEVIQNSDQSYTILPIICSRNNAFFQQGFHKYMTFLQA